MSVAFSKKAIDYIKKKKIINLLVKISFFTQGCIHIYEPKLEPIPNDKLGNFQKNKRLVVNGINIYLSDQYLETYNTQKELYIDLQKFPKQKLILKNLEPIIIQTCKLDK